MDPQQVLRHFDQQVRRRAVPDVPSWTGETLDRVIRLTAPPDAHNGAFIGWQDFAGLDPVEIDRRIAEQVAYFRSTGRPSEWKHYAHDEPADLADRLVAAGLHADDPEALVVGETAGVLAAARQGTVHPDVRVRRTEDPADLAAVQEVHELVWGGDWSWLATDLAQEMTADPASTFVYLAEDEPSGQLACAAWIRLVEGTDFAGLWGGSTHPDWRRRGAYRALVAARAELAAERGVRYLQVDASPESEPILRTLGLVRLSATTPYTWSPEGVA